MSREFFDVIVPKEYSAKNDGEAVTKTVWNKIGRAWLSQGGDSLSFEIFMIPNQRYVIKLTPNKSSQAEGAEEDGNVAPF